MGGLHQSLWSVHQFRSGCSPLAQSIVRTTAHSCHSLTRNTHTQPTPTATTACQDIGCKHLGTLILAGQGTDPSITDTCHSKSCLCCGSLFVASSAFPDRKRTTDDPIAHFPRFKLSDLVFLLPFRLLLRALCDALPTRRPKFVSHALASRTARRHLPLSTGCARGTAYVLLNVQPPVGRRCAYFMQYAEGNSRRTPQWAL